MTTRGFLIWRWVYLAVLAWWAAWFACPHRKQGLSAWEYTVLFGVVPAAAFLILATHAPKIALRFALAYDLAILAAFVYLWFALPDYRELVAVAPLGGFIVEGLALGAAALRSRPHA